MSRVFKVVKYTEQHKPRLRQRWSISTRAKDFRTLYPVNQLVTMPVGLSFVFINQPAAEDFLMHEQRCNGEHARLELWWCDTPDEPQQIARIAGRWSDIPIYWKAYEQDDIDTLVRYSIPCHSSYYGVKSLKLFSRLR